MITSFLVNLIKDLETMYNKNKRLSDSTYPEIDLSFLWQDIENLQKHAELFLLERCAAYRRLAPIGWPKKGRKKSSSPAGGSTQRDARGRRAITHQQNYWQTQQRM
jgi:hypothetical protein